MKPRLSVLVSLCIVLTVISPVGIATAQSTADGANASFPVTLTDATGTEVTIEERPENVTTTSPSAAQVMWELGADQQVVGVTKFAHYLDGAERRQNVSLTEFGVSIERVVATEPDLVLAPNSTGTETVDALRKTGLTVYHFPEATDVEDVKAKTLTIGQLTANRQAARETNAWVDANVEAVSAATADRDHPRLLYPLLGGFAVGGDTFIHEIITTAGADNVAAGEFDGYQVLNDETVITLDPAVLLVTDQTEGQILGAEPYSLTTAGETNQTVVLEVNYINQPAPRSVVYSTRNLTAQLHPGVYDTSEFVTRSEAAASLDASTDTVRDSNMTNESTTDDGDATNISVPGFGPALTVVSLLGGGLLARRRARS